MKKYIIWLCFFVSIVNTLYAQVSKGINFQAIARKTNGLTVPNKTMSVRLSIKSAPTNGVIEYQEIKSVTTNVLGLFTVVIGMPETNKVITQGSFENINWASSEKYIQIEIDTEGSLLFEDLGTQKINYVPYAFYADRVRSQNIEGIVQITQGGTGVQTIKELLTLLNLDKVSNTTDSLKPISISTLSALNDKLKKADTLLLSNRINQKLNSMDTILLSARVNAKLFKTDTITLSNRINQKINIGGITNAEIINGIGYTPVRIEYGSFYDTSKQQALLSTATAVKFAFTQVASNISISNNSSGSPTKITVTHAGVYHVRYALQFAKSDIGTDDISVWIRRNGAAFMNTLVTYTIAGANQKNNVAGDYFIDLGEADYIELFFSVKNVNDNLISTIAQASPTPSRPATPCAAVTIQIVN
jgi:hypothetical protein